MINTDLYDLLGVSTTATASEIKKAFRTLSKTAHPDKGGDEEKFKDIVEAYEILMNPHKRLTYDTTGETNTRDALNALGKFQEHLLNPSSGMSFLKKGYDYLIESEPSIIDTIKTLDKSVKKIKGWKDTLGKQDGEWPKVLSVMEQYLSAYEGSLIECNQDLELCKELIKEYKEVMFILSIPTVEVTPERPKYRGKDMGSSPSSYSFVDMSMFNTGAM